MRFPSLNFSKHQKELEAPTYFQLRRLSVKKHQDLWHSLCLLWSNLVFISKKTDSDNLWKNFDYNFTFFIWGIRSDIPLYSNRNSIKSLNAKVLAHIEANIKAEGQLRLSLPPVVLPYINQLLGMEPSLNMLCSVDSLQVRLCPSQGLPRGQSEESQDSSSL